MAEVLIFFRNSSSLSPSLGLLARLLPHFSGIKQFYIAVDREEWKLDTLCDLYETLTITQAIIYCNTRRRVDWLSEKMQERDFTISCMHGDMGQGERDVIMREFRSGSSRVLITTDLLARGIDVQQVGEKPFCLFVFLNGLRFFFVVVVYVLGCRGALVSSPPLGWLTHLCKQHGSSSFHHRVSFIAHAGIESFWLVVGQVEMGSSLQLVSFSSHRLLPAYSLPSIPL